MRKLVNINKIYTTNFGDAILMTQCPFIDFARELLYEKDLNPEVTLYYHWLNDELKKNKIIFGYIKDKEGILTEYKRFLELIYSIKKYGYRNEYSKPLVVIDGQIYGEIMAREKNSEHYEVYDGTHRLSVMIALGYNKAELTLVE